MKRIRTIHVASHETYGVPRIHAELQAAGEKHGRKRIARLMRAAEIVGVSRRRGTVVTARRDRDARPAPDLVDRDFSASAPNRLWVADITFIPTAAGFLYLAVVLDAFSRRIVGWAMANQHQFRPQMALLFRIPREQRILHLKRSERVHGTATPKRFGRALRKRDEACLTLFEELGHSANASAAAALRSGSNWDPRGCSASVGIGMDSRRLGIVGRVSLAVVLDWDGDAYRPALGNAMLRSR